MGRSSQTAVIILAAFTVLFSINVSVYMSGKVKSSDPAMFKRGPSYRSTVFQGHNQTVYYEWDKDPELILSQRWYNVKDTTHPLKCKVEFLNSTTSLFHMYDHIFVRIEARDWYGKIKKYGGDVFQGKIYFEHSKTIFSSSAADYIHDFKNGSYLARFTLRWVGKAFIEIKLVFVSEAIPVFDRAFNGENAAAFRYGATFISKENKDIQEKAFCGVESFEENMCNLSDPQYNVPWFCQRPKNPKLSCNDWAIHQGVGLKSLLDRVVLNEEEGKVVQWLRTVLPTPKHTIVISERGSEYQTLAGLLKLRKSLPLCGYGELPLKQLHPSAFFYKNSWLDHNCTVRNFDKLETAMQCLNGHSFHFFGDSTSRQIYTYLKTFTSANQTKNSTGLEQIALSDKFLLRFHFHGLPVAGSKPIPTARFSNVPRLVDELQPTTGLVVLISVAVHFDYVGKNVYQQRLVDIKEAILRLRQRVPSAKVIIKLANTRKTYKKNEIAVNNDWINQQFNMMIRKEFSSVPNIGVINAWDMTMAQLFKDDIHPPELIVKAYINRLLTIVCGAG